MRLGSSNQYGLSPLHVLLGMTLVAVILTLVATGVGLHGSESHQARFESVIGALESELAAHVTSQRLQCRPVFLHNPFEGLLNKPQTYVGHRDSTELIDLPLDHWAFCPQDSTVVYRPPRPIVGGRTVSGRQLIAYRVRPIIDGTSVVNLDLVVPTAYAFRWP